MNEHIDRDVESGRLIGSSAKWDDLMWKIIQEKFCFEFYGIYFSSGKVMIRMVLSDLCFATDFLIACKKSMVMNFQLQLACKRYLWSIHIYKSKLVENDNEMHLFIEKEER